MLFTVVHYCSLLFTVCVLLWGSTYSYQYLFCFVVSFSTKCWNLSGGEKRSVGTARALLKAPSILLLDEPTEGLDAQNEKEVMHNLLVGVWFNVYLVTACVLLVYCLCTACVLLWRSHQIRWGIHSYKYPYLLLFVSLNLWTHFIYHAHHCLNVAGATSQRPNGIGHRAPLVLFARSRPIDFCGQGR